MLCVFEVYQKTKGQFQEDSTARPAQGLVSNSLPQTFDIFLKASSLTHNRRAQPLEAQAHVRVSQEVKISIKNSCGPPEYVRKIYVKSLNRDSHIMSQEARLYVL